MKAVAIVTLTFLITYTPSLSFAQKDQKSMCQMSAMTYAIGLIAARQNVVIGKKQLKAIKLLNKTMSGVSQKRLFKALTNIVKEKNAALRLTVGMTNIGSLMLLGCLTGQKEAQSVVADPLNALVDNKNFEALAKDIGPDAALKIYSLIAKNQRDEAKEYYLDLKSEALVEEPESFEDAGETSVAQ